MTGLRLTFGSAQCWLTQWSISGQSVSPLSVCAFVPGSVFSLCSSALVWRPCAISRTLLATTGEIGAVLIH